MAKQIGKGLAGKLGGIGWLVFPDSAGVPEAMYHVRHGIMEIEKRIEEGKASSEDFKKIDKLRKEEDELWRQFGEHHYNQGYEHMFPNKEYIERKKGHAKGHR